jgi:hypothetical protein
MKNCICYENNSLLFINDFCSKFTWDQFFNTHEFKNSIISFKVLSLCMKIFKFLDRAVARVND